MSAESDLHQGHRKRMKERFLATGLDSFSAHEVVELMLYYAIPQRDVNELSHRLIERFTSLSGILEADYEELLKVDGMGPNAATMFRLVCALMRRYEMERGEVPYKYDTINKIGQYCVNLFIGIPVEKAYLLMFDNSMRLIDTVLIAEGSVNAVKIQPRLIIEKALKRNASSIVLAHNHPNGTALPSRDDIVLTSQLEQILELVDINLIDHLIISGKYYMPVIGVKTRSVLSSENPANDPERFYSDFKPHEVPEESE